MFVTILYFEAYNKLIYGIADHLQKNGFLVHNNVQNRCLKLCNRNNLAIRSVKLLTCTRPSPNEDTLKCQRVNFLQYQALTMFLEESNFPFSTFYNFGR